MFFGLFASSGPIGRGKGEVDSDSKESSDSQNFKPWFEVIYRGDFEVDSPQEAAKLFLKELSKALTPEGNLEFRVIRWTTKSTSPNAKGQMWIINSKDVLNDS